MSRRRRFVGVFLIPVGILLTVVVSQKAWGHNWWTTAVICAVGVLAEAGVYMQYRRAGQVA
ncbi:MAG TPA: hypothetical protein VIK61_02880 [Acidimicrobiia bacterium]